MSVALAVLLCRLYVTCAGITAGILVNGVCSTAVAVALCLGSLASCRSRIIQVMSKSFTSAVRIADTSTGAAA